MVQQILRGLLSYSIATGFTVQPALPFSAEIVRLIQSQCSGISAIQGVLSTSRFKHWLCATAASSFTNREHLSLFGDFQADGSITVSLIPSLAWLSVMRVAMTVPARARDILPSRTTMPMQEFDGTFQGSDFGCDFASPRLGGGHPIINYMAQAPLTLILSNST